MTNGILCLFFLYFNSIRLKQIIEENFFFKVFKMDVNSLEDQFKF